MLAETFGAVLGMPEKDEARWADHLIQIWSQRLAHAYSFIILLCCLDLSNTTDF